MGRDWSGLGEKPEPKGTKDPSVRQDKIQIALSIYNSIFAQVALRKARLSTPYPYEGISLITTHGTSLGSAHCFTQDLTLLSVLWHLSLYHCPLHHIYV